MLFLKYMEINTLEQRIKDANWAYWVECNPIISDFEYDELVNQLKKIDPENPLITSFVYADNGDKKIKHSKPMLSLSKAYSFEEVVNWMKKVSRSDSEMFLIMPKYDGLSGKFENGRLSSRGDGIYGQDYTDRLPLIKWLTKDKKDTLLGEMLITNDDFIKYSNIKTKSGIPFKNQRNAAAGIIGCDDIDFYKNQDVKISFIDYDYITYECDLKSFNSKFWENTINKIQALSFPMDGIVIKLKDVEHYENLGATEHSPRGAIAFKYSNPSKWSKLIGVTWSMGKDQLACVGQVEPIEINGSTIKNVKLQITKPLNNDVPYILNGSIAIGDEVLIERAGDIIPHVVKSKISKNNERELIKIHKCPFCGQDLTINSSSIICENPNCKERQIQQLYFSMIVLGFKNIGEVYARTLYEKLNIRSVFDLMTVEEAQLRMDRSFGNKMVDIFINEQNAAKHNSFVKFLTAMNIPKLGQNVAKLLESNFSHDDILNCNFSYEKLISIQGIGPIVAKSLLKNINSKELIKTYKLFSFEQKSESSGNIEICFTGKMKFQRSVMEEIAVKHGLNPVSSVGKNTRILVCADPTSNSSKMKNARKLGIQIISDEEFLIKYPQ
jgi:DNA ligase (NAD+)